MTRRFASALADSGPVLILAGIAAAGSFTHIRETARTHGQRGWMSWAIAVCIDLTCVMAARERQRDKRTRQTRRGMSWPTLVLSGGILLSLAANLAQAEHSVWGWVVAGTPAAAFLVAVSMLERRSSADRPARTAVPSPDDMTVPPSFGSPAAERIPVPDPGPAVERDKVPALSAHRDQDDGGGPARTAGTSPAGAPTPGPLLDFARRVATEHQTSHGRPITRDALRARLGVSNQLASALLRQIRDESTT